MKVLDLFSGIGGLTLAVESLLGCSTEWFCERDPFARRILARHWPEVPIIEDVHTVGDVGADVICGGIPCQPASCAGKQKGEADDRWLWPEAARITAANQPRLCLWENVPGLMSLDSGRAFGGILRAFDAIGYATRWDHCGASAVGAPHRRDRVFLVCVPVEGFTRPGPVQSRPVSMFGYADEPKWPRAGWFAAGKWGQERARWPRGSRPVAWPTPQAHDQKGKPGVESLTYAGLASSLPTSAEAAAGQNWPTPSAMNPNDTENMESWEARRAATKKRVGNSNGFGMPLGIAVRQAETWPTPQAYSHGDSNPPGALKLDHVVWEATGDARAAGKDWPTPRAEDAELAGGHRGVPDSLLSAIRTWPTPCQTNENNIRNATANRDGSKGGKGHHYGKGQTLCDAVEIESGKWPTPTAGDAEGGRTTTGGRDIPTSLNMAAKGADAGLWPTPICNDGDKDGINTIARLVQTGHRRGRRDGTIREGWATPKNSDHRSGKASAETLSKNSRPLQEQAWEASAKPATVGALNPAFSEWLQGFPPGWTEPNGDPLPHVPAGWTDCELTYYGGRPAPKGMPLLTTEKKDRRNRLRCIGNAVVARAALLAFSALVDDQTLTDLAALTPR